jgi:catechol 2,3-dioxygenase-like lactoylglutathione lyase family enzyme
VIEPLGVHHVSINVDDAGEALEFYTAVLGLRPRADRPDFGFGGAWLDIGDQQIHLIESTVPNDCGQHFAIRVADIDAAVAGLRDRGIDVSDPKPVATSRQCFLRDPSGNLIELHEPSIAPGV